MIRRDKARSVLTGRKEGQRIGKSPWLQSVHLTTQAEIGALVEKHAKTVKRPVKSIRYKGPIFKAALVLFVIVFFILGYLGVQPPDNGGIKDRTTQICSVLYFAFFLLMPWYSKLDKCKPEPERVTS